MKASEISVWITIILLLLGGWAMLRDGETKSTASWNKIGVTVSNNFNAQLTKEVVPEATPVEQTAPPLISAPTVERSVYKTDNDNVDFSGRLYISQESGKRYLFKEENGEIKIYENHPRRGRICVGNGRAKNGWLNLYFESTLEDTAGELKLEITDGGESLEGQFTGINPGERSPVVLLHVK